MNDKITNIIYTICMIVITISIVIATYFIIKPEKIYIQEWEHNGISYFLSNANFIEVNK